MKLGLLVAALVASSSVVRADEKGYVGALTYADGRTDLDHVGLGSMIGYWARVIDVHAWLGLNTSRYENNLTYQEETRLGGKVAVGLALRLGDGPFVIGAHCDAGIAFTSGDSPKPFVDLMGELGVRFGRHQDWRVMLSAGAEGIDGQDKLGGIGVISVSRRLTDL